VSGTISRAQTHTSSNDRPPCLESSRPDEIGTGFTSFPKTPTLHFRPDQDRRARVVEGSNPSSDPASAGPPSPRGRRNGKSFSLSRGERVSAMRRGVRGRFGCRSAAPRYPLLVRRLRLWLMGDVGTGAACPRLCRVGAMLQFDAIIRGKSRMR
jgi:hypothetical protein